MSVSGSWYVSLSFRDLQRRNSWWVVFDLCRLVVKVWGCFFRRLEIPRLPGLCGCSGKDEFHVSGYWLDVSRGRFVCVLGSTGRSNGLDWLKVRLQSLQGAGTRFGHRRKRRPWIFCLGKWDEAIQVWRIQGMVARRWIQRQGTGMVDYACERNAWSPI